MKKIYTARDIETLASQGVKELEITNDVIITDVARERAEKLGLRLKRLKGVGGRYAPEADLRQEVRKAVIAQLGLVPENLDAVIDRVLHEMK
jgi:hypothetical protein